jgi:hypothetical protein
VRKANLGALTGFDNKTLLASSIVEGALATTMLQMCTTDEI